MNNKKIDILIYRFSGKQGFFTIPKKWCEECDMLIGLVKMRVREFGEERFNLSIKPWWLYWWQPLIKGGWHPPILMVNGRILSQGIVPTKESLDKALNDVITL